jgi:hypothetical protein
MVQQHIWLVGTTSRQTPFVVDMNILDFTNFDFNQIKMPIYKKPYSCVYEYIPNVSTYFGLPRVAAAHQQTKRRRGTYSGDQATANSVRLQAARQASQ